MAAPASKSSILIHFSSHEFSLSFFAPNHKSEHRVCVCVCLRPCQFVGMFEFHRAWEAANDRGMVLHIIPSVLLSVKSFHFFPPTFFLILLGMLPLVNRAAKWSSFLCEVSYFYLVVDVWWKRCN